MLIKVGGLESYVSFVLCPLYTPALTSLISTHQGGLPTETLKAFNVDPDKDQVFLVYTGSRWLGVHFIGKLVYEA